MIILMLIFLIVIALVQRVIQRLLLAHRPFDFYFEDLLLGRRVDRDGQVDGYLSKSHGYRLSVLI
jgi:hypothetical protein